LDFCGYLGDGGVRDDVQIVAVSGTSQEGAVRTPANSTTHSRLSGTPPCSVTNQQSTDPQTPPTASFNGTSTSEKVDSEI